MAQDLLDIYSDYLIAQSQYARATGLSRLLEGSISHDQVTRFLNSNVFEAHQVNMLDGLIIKILGFFFRFPTFN